MYKRSTALLLVAGLCAYGPPSWADNGDPALGTVTGVGFVEIKRQPDILRVQVDVFAKGKDLKEALAKLKEQQAGAQSRLAILGAVKDSVVFGEPGIASEKTDRQRQFERNVAERIRDREGKTANKNKQPPPVLVSVSLRAELPLKAATTEELLLVFQDLQEKIKAANLNGMKDIEKLSPQEEELAEESKGSRYYDEDGEVKRGEAFFLFVYRVSDEDRAKASAEAFQKAKKEAGRLAAAAGAQLGSLRRLDDQTSGANYDEDGRSSRNYYRLMQQGRLAPSPDLEQAAREASALQPGKVSLRVSISASFNLNASPSK